MNRNLIICIFLLSLASCSGAGLKDNPPAGKSMPVLTDEQLLDTIQYTTFQYFWEGAEPVSGMSRERIHMDDVYPQNDKNVVTSGGTGFGVMAILVGIERGFISREEGISRLDKITSALENADRFHGAWSHWIDGETGKMRPFSLHDNGGDIVETAYLVQGLLTVKQYLNHQNETEKKIYDRITSLVNSVEWSWYQKEGEDILYWHWSPEYGWKINFGIRGYNECLIAYILGVASPTFPLTVESYHKGWASEGKIMSDKEKYGYPLILKHGGNPDYIGPLFWAHYSFLGLNPTGLSDRYADYWTLNRNHTLINIAHCIENPGNYKGYGENCWGLSASYSIGEKDRIALKAHNKDATAFPVSFSYSAHNPVSDDGIISPTAALSSFPYTPEASMKAARFFYDSIGNRLLGPYGFYDAFSLEYNWFPDKYLAIDQGPIVIMIENYRTGLLWNLFMKNPEITQALDQLGFKYPEKP